MLLPTEEERVCVCARIAKEQVAIHQSQSQRKGRRGARSGHRASVWWPLGQLRHQRRGVKMKSSRKINEASWVNALPPPKGSTDGAADDEGDEGGELVQEKKSNGLFLSFPLRRTLHLIGTANFSPDDCLSPFWLLFAFCLFAQTLQRQMKPI